MSLDAATHQPRSLSMRTLVSLLALLLIACGAAPHEATVSPTSQVPAEVSEPLDWARLLPIDTAGFLRVDLARLRRSPHHRQLQPLFDELLADVESPALRQAIVSAIERTELLMIALLSDDADGERRLLILARGDYREDELEQLESSAGEQAVPNALSGQRVWSSRSSDDRTTAAQLRPDIIAVTDTRVEMERLIARTRMRDPSPRWPPSIRALVEASELEQATIGFAWAEADFSDDGVGPVVSLAGGADLDGPLAIDVLAELDSPQTAALFAQLFYNELDLARSAEGVFLPLRSLADIVRVDMDGSCLRGSLRAGPEASDGLVPALLQVFSDAVGAANRATPTPL